MTVSKPTTQEKARQFWSELGYGSTDPLGQMRANFCADAMANFVDSFAAELQKENARLREALNRLLVVFVQRDLDTDDFDEVELARAALSKEKAQ